MVKFIEISIQELHLNTLLHTQSVRPWAFDESGCFLGLKYRYDFTDLMVRQGFNLSDEEIRSTNYWHLLNVPLSKTPRDGGAKWVYSDPSAQAQRFVHLIQSLRKYGYITDETTESLAEFEKSVPVHVEAWEDDVVHVSYLDKPFRNLISVKRLNGLYHCWNGLHRLAALSCLHARGIFPEDRILTYLQESDSPPNLLRRAIHFIRRRL